MGMSDRQFDSYRSLWLMGLQKAKTEIEEGKGASYLEELINMLDTELKRP